MNEMSQSYYICVDFDGTIVDHAYPEIGKPVPHAIETMKKLTEAGHKLILFTMRSGEKLQEALEYLTFNGVSLYGVNENPTQKEWTDSPKAYGNIYIDDAAFGCPLLFKEDYRRPIVNWQEIAEELL